VIGLAPSAVAAQVLADELGIETENTAKWLTEWRRIPELTERRDRFALNLARHAYPTSAGAAKLRARLAAMDQAIAEGASRRDSCHRRRSEPRWNLRPRRARGCRETRPVRRSCS